MAACSFAVLLCLLAIDPRSECQRLAAIGLCAVVPPTSIYSVVRWPNPNHNPNLFAVFSYSLYTIGVVFLSALGLVASKFGALAVLLSVGSTIVTLTGAAFHFRLAKGRGEIRGGSP